MAGKLTDPDYEPTDEELRQLMRDAFADVPVRHREAQQRLWDESGARRAQVLPRLTNREPTGPLDRAEIVAGIGSTPGAHHRGDRGTKSGRVDHVSISDFDRWVSATNVPEAFEYAKGWWDYVELVRRFASRLDTEEVRVIGHYIVETPPPCERLPMPAVAITTPEVTFALRYDFGAWSLKHREISEWVVSVHRRSPYRGPLFGLFDETQDLRVEGVEGLGPDFLFGSYRQDQARFSCLLCDEWDVAMLMRIMAHVR